MTPLLNGSCAITSWRTKPHTLRMDTGASTSGPFGARYVRQSASRRGMPVRLSACTVPLRPAVRAPERPEVRGDLPPCDDAPQDRPFFLAPRTGVFLSLEHRFTAAYVDDMFYWYERAFNCPSSLAARVRWISVLQLFMDFTATTGREPAQYNRTSKAWSLPCHRAVAEVIQVDVPSKLRWFVQTLKAFARVSGRCLVTRETRPYSSTVMVRCLCVAARLAPSRLLVTDGWLAQNTRAGVLLRSRDWHQAPSPKMIPALR